MKEISEIIGKEQSDELRENFWEMLGEDCTYEDVEELFMDYGLEMDYFDQLF